jgi:cell division protein FtsN
MKSQRGGFVMGLIVGLLIGLALALGVALYVTKVPVPFVNKVPMRTAEQDAAEAEKNRNWDPNGPLAGKNASRPGAGASGAATAPPAAAPASAPAAAAPRASAPGSARDPAAILADRPPPAPVRPGADPFAYFVQAGAFARPEDAEQQRARLAMLGYEAKVTEREQSGRTMYRVRIGPFDRKDDADGAKDKLGGVGVDAALVRVQK